MVLALAYTVLLTVPPSNQMRETGRQSVEGGRWRKREGREKDGRVLGFDVKMCFLLWVVMENFEATVLYA